MWPLLPSLFLSLGEVVVVGKEQKLVCVYNPWPVQPWCAQSHVTHVIICVFLYCCSAQYSQILTSWWQMVSKTCNMSCPHHRTGSPNLGRTAYCVAPGCQHVPLHSCNVKRHGRHLNLFGPRICHRAPVWERNFIFPSGFKLPLRRTAPKLLHDC